MLVGKNGGGEGGYIISPWRMSFFVFDIGCENVENVPVTTS